MNNTNESGIPAGFNLISTLHGHTDTILQAVWLPNGRGVASASIDNTVRLWDVENGKETKQLQSIARGFTSVALTLDGRHAATTYWNDNSIDLWHIETASVVRSLGGHTGVVNAVRVAPDGRHLISASDDDTVKVWNLETGQLVMTLHGHTNYVWSTTTTPDGRYVISASADAKIKVWDLQTGAEALTLAGHSMWVTSVVVASDGRTLASASEDRTIRLWDLYTGQMSRVLSGHVYQINCVDFSPDGRLLVSKALDHTVRLWRTDTWEPVAILEEPCYHGRGYYPVGAAFHPSAAVLMTLGERDTVIRLWKLDYTSLLEKDRANSSYTSLKIALIGDTGVGKTGLSYRLTHGKSSDNFGTNYLQSWILDDLSQVREDGTVCQAILWDFISLQDYRLLNPLLLDDVDLAILIFDPSTAPDPLKNVEYWLRHLPRTARKILVGARLDYSANSVNMGEMEDFCRYHDIRGGYVGTSALKGEGIDELISRLHRLIDWSSITDGVSLPLVEALRDTLRDAAEGDTPLMSVDELRARLAAAYPAWNLDDEDLAGALAHVAKQGFVQLLSLQAILLNTDLLVDLSLSILAEVRRNPRGLGAIEETRLWSHDRHLPELARLPAALQDALLEATLERMQRHSLYFVQIFEEQKLLIFPGLVTQKRPLKNDGDSEEDTTYRVISGGSNIYAALVVLLNYTNLFLRSYQWDFQAHFEMGLGEVCGFRMQYISPKEAELVLYFGKGTPGYTRQIFNGIFERFLHSGGGQIAKYPAVACPNCRYRPERAEVVRLMNEGRQYLYCAACGEKVPLLPDDAPHLYRVNGNITDRPAVQTRFNEALRKIKDYFLKNQSDPVRCFISYAWGNETQESWANRLADHLNDAGILVTLDRWDQINFGDSVQPFLQKIEDADFILVVGTPLYRRKFEGRDSSTGTAVAEEVERIQRRLNGDEDQRKTVLPLLLDGDDRKSFPDALHGRVRISFQQERFYFVNLFNLILILYRIPSQDPIIGELRALMRTDNK